MARANRDCQRVYTRLAREVDDLLWLRVVALLCLDLVLDTCQDSKLALYRDVILVCVLYDLTRQLDVLVVWERRTIDHDRREAHVYAVLAELEAISMIQVQYDLWMLAADLLCILDCTLCHVAQKRRVSIAPRTLAHLKDDRRLQL